LAEPLLAEPPFTASLLECLALLVDRIIEAESTRGDIARTDRSALALEAQPYQDLIDRILYRMAGLMDAEVKRPEKRLEAIL
jgi:hypothetical protein